jgi:hypothetical protein
LNNLFFFNFLLQQLAQMITLKVSQKMFPNQNQHGKSFKNIEIIIFYSFH